MKRITPAIKAIADAHIRAKVTNSFSMETAPTNVAEIKAALDRGETIRGILEQIEARYCSVGSSVLAAFGGASHNYTKGVYDGFKYLYGKAFPALV